MVYCPWRAVQRPWKNCFPVRTEDGCVSARSKRMVSVVFCLDRGGEEGEGRKMAAVKSVHEKYMGEALKQAKKAFALGEVPIGCVIVQD